MWAGWLGCIGLRAYHFGRLRGDVSAAFGVDEEKAARWMFCRRMPEVCAVLGVRRHACLAAVVSGARKLCMIGVCLGSIRRVLLSD